MSTRRFDFQTYVDVQKNPRSGRDERTGFGAYAFAGDLLVLKRLQALRPVNVVVEATLRLWKTVQRNELLGKSVKVSMRQFPELHATIAECASTLHIPMPTVYVGQGLGSLEAGTFGTEDEAYIFINSATVDYFDERELKFLIGRECGHIQNNHMVYITAANFLRYGLASYARWVVKPAEVALNSWTRRGDITCDRAGLLCTGDLDVAIRALVKLALGSEKLSDQVDIDEYMAQLGELQRGMGRFAEYLEDHPHLPKRIEALRLFADSKYYKQHVGVSGGRPIDEIDREVEEIVSVF